MSSLHRVAGKIALTLVPLLGIGCAQLPRQTISSRTAPYDPRMTAAKREESRGNYAQAKNMYAEIHRQDPRAADCAHRLAVVCTMLNRYEEAELYFRQAYAITPSNAELLADMGYLAYQRKDFEKAESFLEQSVRLNGTDQRNINNLAIARAWRGKDESSLATFRTICSEEEAVQRLTAIQATRGENTRVQSSTNSMAQATPRTPASGRAKIAAVDSNSVDLPAPAPLDIVTVSTTEQVTIETVDRSADLKMDVTTEVTSEVTVELPSLLPPLPVESAPEELPPAPEMLVEVTESTRSSSVPFEFAAAPSTQAEDKNAGVVQLDSQLIVAAIPMPSPPSPPASLPEVPASDSQQAWTSRPESIWRKTPASRSGIVDGQPVHWNQPEIWQTSASSEATDAKKKEWGVCLVTLAEENRLELGLPEFSMEYQSRHYRFSSADALTRFRVSPQRYVPAAEGLDVVAAKTQQKQIAGTLNFAQWYQRQLYLFSSRENAEAFGRDPAKYLSAE